MAHGIFCCSTWAQVPSPGTDPGHPAWAARSLGHWITKEVPGVISSSSYLLPHFFHAGCPSFSEELHERPDAENHVPRKQARGGLGKGRSDSPVGPLCRYPNSEHPPRICLRPCLLHYCEKWVCSSFKNNQ